MDALNADLRLGLKAVRGRELDERGPVLGGDGQEARGQLEDVEPRGRGAIVRSAFYVMLPGG